MDGIPNGKEAYYQNGNKDKDDVLGMNAYGIGINDERATRRA